MPPGTERPAKHDVVIAIKAIHFAPGYSSVDRAVAALILEHFNKQTGQCDPSNGRLAAMLGIDERTVRRATAELCGDGRLFRKVSHGGKSGRASYTPQWRVFRSIVADLERCMQTGARLGDDAENRAKSPGSLAASNRAKQPGSSDRDNRAISPGASAENEDGEQGEMVRQTGRNGPVEQGEIALQTYRKNPFKEPIGATEASEHDSARGIEPKKSEQMSHRLLSGNAEGPKARKAQSKEPAATLGQSRSEAAWKSAVRRVTKAVGCEPTEWIRASWLLDPDDYEDAYRAERNRRGEGIALLRVRLVNAWHRYEAGFPARDAAP